MSFRIATAYDNRGQAYTYWTNDESSSVTTDVGAEVATPPTLDFSTEEDFGDGGNLSQDGGTVNLGGGGDYNGPVGGGGDDQTLFGGDTPEEEPYQPTYSSDGGGGGFGNESDGGPDWKLDPGTSPASPGSEDDWTLNDPTQPDETPEGPKTPPRPRGGGSEGGSGQPGAGGNTYTPPDFNFDLPSFGGVDASTSSQKSAWGASYGGMSVDPVMKAASKNYQDAFKGFFNQLPLNYF